MNFDDEIDIYSKGEYPANVLSNFYPNSFVFDDVLCHSMEGFLQSLKYKNPKKQKKICEKIGKEAKKYSKRAWLWKFTGHLYWKKKKYHRLSDDFKRLIYQAYQAMYKQNPIFQEALEVAKGYRLKHSIGHHNPRKTILTEEEFISILNHLRNQDQI